MNTAPIVIALGSVVIVGLWIVFCLDNIVEQLIRIRDALEKKVENDKPQVKNCQE